MATTPLGSRRHQHQARPSGASRVQIHRARRRAARSIPRLGLAVSGPQVAGASSGLRASGAAQGVRAPVAAPNRPGRRARSRFGPGTPTPEPLRRTFCLRSAECLGVLSYLTQPILRGIPCRVRRWSAPAESPLRATYRVGAWLGQRGTWLHPGIRRALDSSARRALARSVPQRQAATREEKTRRAERAQTDASGGSSHRWLAAATQGAA